MNGWSQKNWAGSNGLDDRKLKRTVAAVSKNCCVT